MNETDKIRELERLNKLEKHKKEEYFYEIQGLRKANKDLREYIEKFTISKKLAKDLLCLAIDNEYVEFPLKKD